jgi:hypothetical protein
VDVVVYGRTMGMYMVDVHDHDCHDHDGITYSTSEPAVFFAVTNFLVHHRMAPQRDAPAVQDEGRLELALQAYSSGQFKSLQRAAAAFNVTHQQLSD